MADVVGTCPRCHNEVYKNQLFVSEGGEVYHYSCYNKMKKVENEK